MAIFPRATGRVSWPVVLLCCFVVVAHLPYLVGAFSPNPIFVDSNLAIHLHRGLLPGGGTIDPNAGFTSQALGHRAILDWIHGHVPWWNPLEGLGAPLAGEMQNAAFFPLIIFLLLSNGQVWFFLILDLVAALATFYLLRRLGIRPWICLACGLAFGLNGTMAWFRFAPANPVCFLPLLLLGIERCRTAAVDGRRRGWGLAAAALALSLVAGFPETAYIDALAAVVWACARTAGLGRSEMLRFAQRLATGVVVGVVLAGPVLVAFVDYVPNAYLGSHSVFGHEALPRTGVAALLFPYLYGPIFGFATSAAARPLVIFWSSVGGYLTGSLVLLATIGLLGRSYRALRIVLAGWALFVLGRIFGVGWAMNLFNLIPGVSLTAAFRYAYPALEIAVVVLAGLGMEDLASGAARRVRVGGVAVVAAAISVLAIRRGLPVARLGVGPSHLAWAWASIAWGAVLMSTIVVVALVGRRRLTQAVVVTIVGLDAMAMFVVPELSAPRSGTIDTMAVSYLQEHIGQSRFFTLGPIAADYGSYFGLASLNTNDLPVPKLWNQLVRSSLDPNATAISFTGFSSTSGHGPTPAQAFVEHLGSYEALGVEYLLAPTDAGAVRLDGPVQLKVEYRDPSVTIFRVPATRPLFESGGPGPGPCRVEVGSISRAHVVCSRPAVITRSELFMPGWAATVNGHPVRVGRTRSGLQTVAVPAGTSTVAFSFLPPYMSLALGASVLAAAYCVLPALSLRPRKRYVGRHLAPRHQRRGARG